MYLLKEYKFSKVSSNFNSNFFICLISIFFSILIGEGVYGYGNDYYAIYHEKNLNFGGMFNRLGWIISTFALNDYHLGVHVTTFILCISFGFFLKSILKIKKINNLYFLIFIFIIAIHTWPIIMSTSNAMRQGLAMSMLFLALACQIEKKTKLSFLFIFLMLFMHKTGPFLALAFIYSLIIFYSFKKIKTNQNILFAFSGFLFCFINYFLVKFLETGAPNSRIIHGDFRYHFLFLSFIYFLLFHYKDIFFKEDILSFFVYYYNFATVSTFFLKLNYEYERLQMISLIPLIFACGMNLNKRSIYFYYITIFIILFLATVYNGMYKSLL